MIRSDNGKEYVNNVFNDFLTNCGIKRQLTVPYTPQQNGVAERANRTLVEMARSLLLHANLEEALWAEAIATAAYLRNRSPTKVLSNLTPFEAWYERKPQVAHLKVFGCKAFALNKNQHNKFKEKGNEYIFVGYSLNAKAYRLYDRATRKVIERRDVKFIEDVGEANVINSYTETPEINKNTYFQDFSDIPIKSDENQQLNSNNSEDEFYSDDYSSETEINDETIVASKNKTVHKNESAENVAEADENVDQAGEDADQEIDENPANQNPNKLRAGRPRLIRTGLPGRPRKEFIMLNSTDNDDLQTPTTVNEALKGPNAIKWKESMKKEYDALVTNDTWSLVDLPLNLKAIGTRWVFRIKVDNNGNVKNFKSRLVAKGCNQQFGINYWETFSPVIRYENIRLIFALAVEMKLFLYQLDISNAYLNGKLSEEVYIKQPEGFIDKKYPNKVLKLKKAIYGLKQSGRVWNCTLDIALKNIGFIPCESEPCLYTHKNEQTFNILAVYVDDILLACSHKSQIQIILDKLSRNFKVHDCGPLKSFLGMEIERKGEVGPIRVSHKQYIKNILFSYGMSQCRPVATPLDPGFKVDCNNVNCPITDIKNYQSMIGSLMYLAITTRPDIQFATCMLAQRNASPHQEHEAAVKHVLRYLSATINNNILFHATGEQVKGYVDADWAGDSVDRKSYSGYVFIFGGGTISWEAKKQSVVALSSTEAEYIALSVAAKEAIYLRRLLKEINWQINSATEIKVDNLSSKQLAENPINHKRTKHIDIRYHHVRETITKNEIKLNYVSTNENVADLFTKPLQKQKHLNFVNMLNLNSRY